LGPRAEGPTHEHPRASLKLTATDFSLASLRFPRGHGCCRYLQRHESSTFGLSRRTLLKLGRPEDAGWQTVRRLIAALGPLLTGILEPGDYRFLGFLMNWWLAQLLMDGRLPSLPSEAAPGSLSPVWTACIPSIRSILMCLTQDRTPRCSAWPSAPLAESPAALKLNPSGWDCRKQRCFADRRASGAPRDFASVNQSSSPRLKSSTILAGAAKPSFS
jgi:hypothetical protein